MKTNLGWTGLGTTGFLVSCVGREPFGPEGLDRWGPMMHYGFGYGGMFMWIIFVIVVGLLVYFVVQAQKTKSPAGSGNGDPLDILKRRYAKGEITKATYEEMREDLER